MQVLYLYCALAHIHVDYPGGKIYKSHRKVNNGPFFALQQASSKSFSRNFIVSGKVIVFLGSLPKILGAKAQQSLSVNPFSPEIKKYILLTYF